MQLKEAIVITTAAASEKGKIFYFTEPSLLHINTNFKNASFN